MIVASNSTNHYRRFSLSFQLHVAFIRCLLYDHQNVAKSFDWHFVVLLQTERHLGMWRSADIDKSHRREGITTLNYIWRFHGSTDERLVIKLALKSEDEMLSQLSRFHDPTAELGLVWGLQSGIIWKSQGQTIGSNIMTHYNLESKTII